MEKGWQRRSRLSASSEPFHAPYFSTASSAYCEQVGMKRQHGGLAGDRCFRYARMSAMRIRFMVSEAPASLRLAGSQPPAPGSGLPLPCFWRRRRYPTRCGTPLRGADRSPAGGGGCGCGEPPSHLGSHRQSKPVLPGPVFPTIQHYRRQRLTFAFGVDPAESAIAFEGYRIFHKTPVRILTGSVPCGPSLCGGQVPYGHCGWTFFHGSRVPWNADAFWDDKF